MSRRQHIEGLYAAIARTNRQMDAICADRPIGDIAYIQEYDYEYQQLLAKHREREAHLTRLLAKERKGR